MNFSGPDVQSPLFSKDGDPGAGWFFLIKDQKSTEGSPSKDDITIPL